MTTSRLSPSPRPDARDHPKIQILLLAPTLSIGAWIRQFPPQDQLPTARILVPRLYADAMAIRTAVFVSEQNVPQAYEADDDDPRCFHWVAYSTPEPSPNHQDGQGTKQPVLAPVGVLRVVPPPHTFHPLPGAKYEGNKLVGFMDGFGHPSSSSAHDSCAWHEEEPYVKISRLAVLKSHRGKGLGRQILREAVEWMTGHPDDVFAGGGSRRWEGKVVINAQKRLAGWYARAFGFAVDERMGEWREEGMVHVGMVRWLDVRK